jgi:hypothetical protein
MILVSWVSRASHIVADSNLCPRQAEGRVASASSASGTILHEDTNLTSRTYYVRIATSIGIVPAVLIVFLPKQSEKLLV